MSALPDISIRGIRQTIPSGYVLGRTSSGSGPAQLIPFNALTNQMASSIISITIGSLTTSGNGITITNGSTLSVEWNAGTVGHLGTGLALTGGTLTPNWQVAVVTNLGTITNGATVEINSGTLSVVIPGQEWTAGAVSALGTNASGTLSISGGTLSLSGISSEWSAGTVTALGPNIAINSNTIEAVVSAPTGVTWNTSDAHAGSFLFSNGNLTVSNNGALSQWYSGRATASVSTGKWYAEFLCVATDAAKGLIIGLANGTQVLTNYVGSSNNGIGYQTSGDVWLNGTAIQPDTGSDGFGAGQYAAIAWDMGAQLVWFYSPVNGFWNNSSSANPATGVGGYSFSAVSGALFLAFSMEIAAGGTNADEGTLNVGASAFNYTVPSGFTPAGQATVAITNIGSGLTVTSGTLSASALSGAWNAGTVSAIGTGLSINSGTLNPNWQLGSVTALAAGLTLASGTITPNWEAGTVAAVGSNLTIASGNTLNIGTNPTIAGSLTSVGLIVPTGTVGVQGNASGTAVQAGSIGERQSAGFSGAANASGTVTLTLGSPGTVNYTAHGLTGCMPVQFSTTGALPTGLTGGVTYYTVPSSITTNAFKVATTVANAFAGTAVNFTGSQSGTQTCFLFGVCASTTQTVAGALNLTAGDWDVQTIVYFVGTSGNITDINGWVNNAASAGPIGNSLPISVGAGGLQNIFVGTYRALLSGTTVIYTVGEQLGGSTNGITCVMWARRVG